MMHELKTCPFCGGTPYIESHSRGFVGGESTRVAYVRCVECNMRTARIPISIGEAEAVKKVVRLWNMRYNGVTLCNVGDHRR